MKIKGFAPILVLLLFVAFAGFSQEEKEVFIIEKEIKHLPVISQGGTGTCWSFATTSFIESEIIRKGFTETDLSEMFFVYYGYINKAKQFLMYQGNNNFGQGGQAHDVLDVLSEKGMVTFDEFPGEKIEGKYQHNNLISDLKAKVEALNKNDNNFSVEDLKAVNSILKSQIGKIPQKIKNGDNKYSPEEFAKKYNLNPDDYIEISSYSHHPFYKQFILEVPDNWAHELYYNVPIGEMMEVMYNAINNGYTVCWDGDTSEKTFTHKKGKADLPENQLGKVDQKLRQETFLNRTTTDDHLMHIVGLSKDSEGRNCFYTKNSWGAESNSYDGYLHMTDDYVRLKTMAIMVHKDAVPENIRKKLNL
ncbi:MAG TPA: C1 family peptidase [Draconibacterium sp.]|nr:C1 family peptidase [Draconibacterium sp.]HRX10527.1 C1 family peptidase [Draconibacterium sp.]